MSLGQLAVNIDAGKVSWGDISWADDVMNPKCNINQNYSLEEEMLEWWSVPDLTLRKGIWENFPVSLIPIVDGDGTDRYAVVWHRKNFQAWRETRAETFDIYLDYDFWCEMRLRYALNAYSHKYTVEEPRGDDMILVIAMVHAPKNDEDNSDSDVSTVSTVSTAPVLLAPITETSKTRDTPRLTRLNDIKNNFPVVWHETYNATGSKLYAIELFGKKIKEISIAAGYDVTEEISNRLMSALKSSTAWRVFPAESPREFCRIELV